MNEHVLNKMSIAKVGHVKIKVHMATTVLILLFTSFLDIFLAKEICNVSLHDSLQGIKNGKHEFGILFYGWIVNTNNNISLYSSSYINKINLTIYNYPGNEDLNIKIQFRQKLHICKRTSIYTQ